MMASYSAAIAATTTQTNCENLTKNSTDNLLHRFNAIPEFVNSVSLTIPTGIRITSLDILNSFEQKQYDMTKLKSLQKHSSGKYIITFHETKDYTEFLSNASFPANGQLLHINDSNRPITFVNLYDVPDDFFDELITKRLAPYCEVVSSRRGFYQKYYELENGVRHYRVKLKRHIPNFIRFGRTAIMVKYDGQPTTCRNCHQVGHLGSQCKAKMCYNCDGSGHHASSCPKERLCSLCKEEEHFSCDCPFNWINLGSECSSAKQDDTEDPDPPAKHLNNSTIEPADLIHGDQFWGLAPSAPPAEHVPSIAPTPPAPTVTEPLASVPTPPPAPEPSEPSEPLTTMETESKPPKRTHTDSESPSSTPIPPTPSKPSESKRGKKNKIKVKQRTGDTGTNILT